MQFLGTADNGRGCTHTTEKCANPQSIITQIEKGHKSSERYKMSCKRTNTAKQHHGKLRSLRQTHGAHLRMDHPRLDFATKYGHKNRASSTANCIPRQTLSFTYVWNSSNLTLRTFAQTLLQSPVWDKPYVGTHRECGEKILVFTWWCFDLYFVQECNVSNNIHAV